MTKFTFLCALAALACESPDSSDADLLDIHVDVSANPTFSWPGGAMHEFEVFGCDANCACDDGYPLGDFTPAWRLSIDILQDPLPAPHVFPPVQYGIWGGNADPNARPLETGATYFVNIGRYVECDDDPHDCARVVALGCTSFVAP